MLEVITMAVTVYTWIWVCAQHLARNKKRRVTCLCKDGLKSYPYTDAQLERERNEKSVLSSQGLKVKELGKGIDGEVKWGEI